MAAYLQQRQRWLVLGVGSIKLDYERWNSFFKGTDRDFDAISESFLPQDNPFVKEACDKYNHKQLKINFNKTEELDLLENDKYDVVVCDCSVTKFFSWTIEHLKIIKKKVKINGKMYIPKEYMLKSIEGKIKFTVDDIYRNAISKLVLNGSMLIIGTQMITHVSTLIVDKVEINNIIEIEKKARPVIETVREQIDIYNVYLLQLIFGSASKVNSFEGYPYPQSRYCRINQYYIVTKEMDNSLIVEIDSNHIKEIFVAPVITI